MLKKNYTWLMLSVLLGALVLLQNGCAWTVSGYSRYPYYYNNYYWYPYGGYNWRP